MPARDFVFELEVQDNFDRVEARLKGLESRATRGTKAVDRQTRTLTQSIERGRRFLGRLFAAYAAFSSVRVFVRLTAEAQSVTNQVRAATEGQREYNSVYSDLLEISNRTRTQLQSSVNLFRVVNRLTPELQQSREQSFQFIETVNQTAQISGASAVDIKNSLRQLGQGLSSGKFRAEEFNSVIENTPEIANRIAIGMGLTVGQLRTAVVNGNVLSRDVFDALLSQSEEINAEFNDLPLTIDQATTSLGNNILDLANTINEEFGVGGAIAATIDGLSSLIEGLNTSLREYGELSRANELVNADRRNLVSSNSNNAGTLNRGISQQDALANEQLARSERERLDARIGGGDTAAVISQQEVASTRDRQAGGRNGLQRTARTADKQVGDFVNQDASDAEQIELETEAALEALQVRYEAQQELFQGNATRLIEIEQEYQDDNNRIAEEGARRRIQLHQQETRNRLSAASTLLGGLAALASSQAEENAEAFNIAKNLSIAQAIVNTYLGATEALKLGPIAGPIGAAGVIALGLAQVDIIRQQKPQNRRFGGQGQPGQTYEYGEGGAVETFTSGGRSYALPNKRGEFENVGGGTPNIQIINNTGVQVTATATTEADVMSIVLDPVNVGNLDTALSDGVASGDSSLPRAMRQDN